MKLLGKLTAVGVLFAAMSGVWSIRPPAGFTPPSANPLSTGGAMLAQDPLSTIKLSRK